MYDASIGFDTTISVSSGNMSLSIGFDTSISVSKGNVSASIGSGGSITAFKGNVSASIGSGGSITASKGNVSASIGSGGSITASKGIGYISGSGKGSGIKSSNGMCSTIGGPSKITLLLSNTLGSITSPVSAFALAGINCFSCVKNEKSNNANIRINAFISLSFSYFFQ